MFVVSPVANTVTGVSSVVIFASQWFPCLPRAEQLCAALFAQLQTVPPQYVFKWQFDLLMISLGTFPNSDAETLAFEKIYLLDRAVVVVDDVEYDVYLVNRDWMWDLKGYLDALPAFPAEKSCRQAVFVPGVG